MKLSWKNFCLYGALAIGFGLLFLFSPMPGVLPLGLSLGLGAAVVSLIMFVTILVITRDTFKKRKPLCTQDLWLLLPLTGMVAVFLVEKAEFKIHHDETAIATMAVHLSEYGTPQVITRAFDLKDTGYLVLDNQMDKRPPLYPFLVSILHRSLGFHANHPFWVNRALAVLGLALLALTLRHRFGSVTSAMASTFLVLVPQWGASAHSGGLEMLFLSLWTLFLGVVLDRGYQNLKGQLLLLFIALAMAWTRYEGLAVVASVLLLIGFSESLRSSGKKLKIALPACVLFSLIMLLPLVLLHRTSTAESWRWEEPQIFSPGFIPGNVMNALEYFLFPSFGTTALPWLSFVVVLVLIFQVIIRRKIPYTPTLLWGGLPVLAISLVIFSFFHGDLAHPITSRLSLPFWLVTVLTLAWATSRINGRQIRTSILGLTLILGISILRFQDPLAYRQHNSQLLIQEAKRDLFEKWVGPAEPEILVADQPSLLAIALGYGAINWEIRPGFLQRLALDSNQTRFKQAYLMFQSRYPDTDSTLIHRLLDSPARSLSPLEVRQVGNTFIHLHSLNFPSPRKGRGDSLSPSGIPYWILDLP